MLCIHQAMITHVKLMLVYSLKWVWLHWNPVLTVYPICASVPGKGGVYLILQGSVEMISQESVSKKTSSTVVSLAVYNWAAVALSNRLVGYSFKQARVSEYWRAMSSQWNQGTAVTFIAQISAKDELYFSLYVATLCLSHVRRVYYWGSLYLTIREYSR